MQRQSLIASLLAVASLGAAQSAMLSPPKISAANGGVHRHPARGATGALKIRRAARHARNVQRNRKAHRG